MLRIQTEIIHDPSVHELLTHRDKLQAGGWTGEENQGTGGQGHH